MNHTPHESPATGQPRSDSGSHADGQGVANVWLNVAVVVGVFLVVAGSFIVARVIPNRAVFDQRHYHQPTIEGFAKEWPAIDVWDYLSATTPGYHWVLAGVLKVFGAGVAGLQVVSMVFSAGLFGLVAWMVGRGMRDRSGAAPGFGAAFLCMPIVCCTYFIVGGIALLPDNAGWLGVCAVLALALHAKSMRALCGVGCVVLLALVLTRQVHLWTCGLLVLASWLGCAVPNVTQDVKPDFSTRRFSRAAIAAIACVPALIAVALFVRYWGGLVPPRFQLQYPPKPVSQFFASPAPAFVLSVCAIFGAFLIGFWWQGFRALWTRMRWVLLVVVVVGMALAVAPATNFDYLAGRRTGLWNLTRHAPVLFERTSVLIAVLAPIGGVVLASFFVSLRERGLVRDAAILLATLAGYAIVLTASNEVWQRYVEPLVLVVMVLMCARVGFETDAALTSRSMVGADSEKGAPSVTQGTDRLSPIGGTAIRCVGVVSLSIALIAITLKTMSVGLEKLSDPPPPAITADHIGPTPPVLLPRPEKPAGKKFW